MSHHTPHTTLTPTSALQVSRPPPSTLPPLNGSTQDMPIRLEHQGVQHQVVQLYPCTPEHPRRRLALVVWPTSRTAGASEQAVLSTAVGFVVKPQMKHFFFPFGAPSLPLSGQNADHAGVSLVFRIAQGSTRASARICEPSFSLSLVPCTGEALVWSVLGLR